MLRDGIVCGVRDQHSQQWTTLARKSDSPEGAGFPQWMVTAVVSAAILLGKDSHQTTEVSGFRIGSDVSTNPSLDQREPLYLCCRCAKIGNSPALCKFKNAKCHHCGKLGYIRPACKSREKTNYNPKKLKNIHHVQKEQDEGDREHSLFSITSYDTSKLYTVMLEVPGR